MIQNSKFEKIDDKTAAEKIKDFTALLETIDSLDDKKRHLWKEIYRNALQDRELAFTMFSELFMIVNTASSSSSEHSIHGQNLARYLERMSKANDQLLKLAEQIALAQEQAEGIDQDAVFKQITEESTFGKVKKAR